MSEAPFLSLRDVSVGYGRQVVLREINFDVKRGSFTALLGENGSGKSTLIKTILRIIPPLSGTIQFSALNGEPRFGYTPQRDILDPMYLFSSLEVVLMGICGRVGPLQRINRAERDFALSCLKQAGADHLSGILFSRLSGGQKQRVLIARALASKPDFLLLDEPTSGIDAAARQAIMQLLQKIQAEQQITILMSSHDLPMVRRYAQEAIWLHRGKILSGSAAELLSLAKIEEILDLELS